MDATTAAKPDKPAFVGAGTFGALDRIRKGLEPLTNRLLGPTLSEADAVKSGLRSFEHEADELISRQRTRGAQLLVRAALLAVVVLLVWAALAPVDEVTRGEARVIPSRQLQVVQSLDGGVVAEILVREGQLVEAGQLLLRIDETRAGAGVRESAAQGFALRARSARLRAQAEGGAFVPPATKDPVEKRIALDEQRLYQSRMNELATQLSINRQQLVQRQQELSEVQSKRSAAQRGLELSQQELAQTRPLLATGAVSQVDVLRLERDVVRFRGEMEQATAQIARSQAAIGESERKAQETDLAFRNEARKELAETMAKLNALNEGAVALADKVDKAQVKSPVRGRVQRLLANTVGG
ncbi:MAG: biotin/lipoyl-binding protein, partial [Burkholderiaceae bacterium]|nr:biotin/lipoyl-binding protein [Burkholderiaceae bacterium]